MVTTTLTIRKGRHRRRIVTGILIIICLLLLRQFMGQKTALDAALLKERTMMDFTNHNNNINNNQDFVTANSVRDDATSSFNKILLRLGYQSSDNANTSTISNESDSKNNQIMENTSTDKTSIPNNTTIMTNRIQNNKYDSSVGLRSDVRNNSSNNTHPTVVLSYEETAITNNASTNTTTTASSSSSSSIIVLKTPTGLAADAKQKQKKKQRNVVIFIHFHKAGGTSMVKLFERHLTTWQPNINGNPWTNAAKAKKQKKGSLKSNNNLIPYWRHNASQFQNFLNLQPNVEFLANEWNFFTNVSSKSELQNDNDINVELVSCMRDPYSRFVSNLYFNGGGLEEQPFLWIDQNLTWATIQRVNYRPKENDFPVNYNKPNYYVAFLNGLADTEYNWKDLNATHHLQVAKERLHWFTSIILLDRPETHAALLRRWIPTMGEQELPKANTAHSNKASRSTSNNKRTMVGMSREEFNELNRLDVELYEYAVNISLTQLAAARARAIAA